LAQDKLPVCRELNSKGEREKYFQDLDNSGDNHAIGLTYTLNATTVNELVIAKTYTQWLWAFTDPSQVSRDRMGNPPHWYDTAALKKLITNDAYCMYAEYIPGVSFAGGQLPNSPPSARRRVPIMNPGRLLAKAGPSTTASAL
jgi:hypothetical protein